MIVTEVNHTIMRKQLTVILLGFFILLSMQGLAQADNEKIAATQKQIQKDQRRADKLASKAKKQERKRERHENKMQRKEKKRERKLNSIERGQRKLEDLRKDSTRSGASIYYLPAASIHANVSVAAAFNFKNQTCFLKAESES